jgi:chromate transporter
VPDRQVPLRQVPLPKIAREWGRIGITGFGGPPTHIALLRRLCVTSRGWLTEEEFEDGIAAVNMLPGPSSTQLTIFCAWRLGGPLGALVGGACFILPGFVAIVLLSTLFLRAHPPLAIAGAAAGAGAAVPVVALAAATALLPASWRRASSAASQRAARARWAVYAAAGVAASATPPVAPWLVGVLVACGAIEAWTEVGERRRQLPAPGRRHTRAPALLSMAAAMRAGHALLRTGAADLPPLIWVAFKVGALSFGGGFVIIPLMQHDVVYSYHFMSRAHFLDAVALGQVTPGPVVLTVASVGWAAAGLAGAVVGLVLAFAPSFLFVMAGGGHFGRLRSNATAQRGLTGAGAAAIGGIAGASVPLALAIAHVWQLGILAVAALWLLALRRGVVPALLGAGVLGVIAVLAGAPA